MNYLIVGGSSGIGLAAAQRMTTHGAVYIASRDAARLESAKRTMESSAHEVTAIQADVTKEEGRARIVDLAPPLTGLVYSAGTNQLKPLQFLNEQFLQDMLKVHLQAPLLLIQQLLKHQKISKNTSIVLLGSVAASKGTYGTIAYAAAKGALQAALKPLALELAKLGVRVNIVAPGLVDSALTERVFNTLPPEAKTAELSKYPLGLTTPSEVASLLEFLLSPASAHTTGSLFHTDGGYLC